MDVKLSVPLSSQAVSLLQNLVNFGIFGATPEEVAGRFIETKLQDYIWVEVDKKIIASKTQVAAAAPGAK